MAFLRANQKRLLVTVVLMLFTAASIILYYDGTKERESLNLGHTGAALANASDMLRELFARSPGPRTGKLLATKHRPADWPTGQAEFAHPRLQQRALGKIFDDEPTEPYFEEPVGSGPFVLPPVLGDPLRDYTPQAFTPLPLGPRFEYGGNPPFYLVTPDGGGGNISPPAAAPIPEPATWVMLLLGKGFCGAVLRHRRSGRKLAGRRT